MKPDDSIDFIAWLFQNKCVGLPDTDNFCLNRGRDRSHIIPRSRGKVSEGWKNTVYHCASCHTQYHNMGASETNISNLQDKRSRFLEIIGRGKYV